MRAEISILPVAHKGSPNQPGYRVRLDGIEVGAGWHRTDLASRKEDVSLSLSRGRGTPYAPPPVAFRTLSIACGQRASTVIAVPTSLASASFSGATSPAS